MGPSLFVIVEDGEPRLGTWQSVYLYEGDGPRSRSIWVQWLPASENAIDCARRFVLWGLSNGPAAGIPFRRRGRLLARFFWESFLMRLVRLSALRRTLLRRPCPVRSISS